jgi:hypothetical protein
VLRICRPSASIAEKSSIRLGTSRRAASSRRARYPSTMKRTSRSSPGSIHASIRSSRTHGSRHPTTGCCRCSYSGSFARAAAGGSQYPPCGPRHALLHWSIHARCPSGELPFRPCWQFRVAWLDPSRQNRDLLWPRVLLPVPGLPWFAVTRVLPASPTTATEVPRLTWEVIDWQRFIAGQRAGNKRDVFAVSEASNQPGSRRRAANIPESSLFRKRFAQARRRGVSVTSETDGERITLLEVSARHEGVKLHGRGRPAPAHQKDPG